MHLLVVVAMLILSAATPVPNQNKASSNALLSEALIKLRSDDWIQRSSGLSQILKTPKSLEEPSVRVALIELMARENEFLENINRKYEKQGFGSDREGLGEGYSEYNSTLLGIVDRFANLESPRELSILAHSAYNSDSPFAARLATQGKAVLPIFLELANSDLVTYRGTAMGMLGEVALRNPKLASADLQQIKSTLIRGMNDEAIHVRWMAVEAAGRMGDPTFVPKLIQIKKSDPGSYTADHGKIRRFPVREEASKVVRSIRERTTKINKSQ